MPVMAVHKFERFFRLAGDLDVDKNDLKRYSDFVVEKTYDLLVLGQARANANGRDIIEPADLPITKGLQESIHVFRKLEDEIDLEPILAQLAVAPPLDAAISDDTRTRLPAVVGGLSVALARTFRIIDTDVKNPQTTHWERLFRIFDLLL